MPDASKLNITYFTHCCLVIIAEFEEINASWA